MRSPTSSEIRWWRRFAAVVKSMPKTIEVLVSAQDTLTATERGAEKAYFEKHGDLDNVPTFCELKPIDKSNIICNDSSF